MVAKTTWNEDRVAAMCKKMEDRRVEAGKENLTEGRVGSLLCFLSFLVAFCLVVMCSKIVVVF